MLQSQNQDSCSNNLFYSIIGNEKPSGRGGFHDRVMEFAGFFYWFLGKQIGTWY